MNLQNNISPRNLSPPLSPPPSVPGNRLSGASFQSSISDNDLSPSITSSRLPPTPVNNGVTSQQSNNSDYEQPQNSYSLTPRHKHQPPSPTFSHTPPPPSPRFTASTTVVSPRETPTENKKTVHQSSNNKVNFIKRSKSSLTPSIKFKSFIGFSTRRKSSGGNGSTSDALQNGESKDLYVVLYNYAPRTQYDLAVVKRQQIIVLRKLGDWCLARSLNSTGEGYVPANYIAKVGLIEGEEWYVGKQTRGKCEQILLQPGCTKGTFLIRKSQTCPGFALSVVLKTKQRLVKHYRIFEEMNGSYNLSRKHYFPTLQELVSHYKKSSGILCCKLTNPCQFEREPPPTATMAIDLWEIDRNELTLITKLGQGHFGEVWKGMWNSKVEVAVKKLKPGSMKPEDFSAEADVMKTLRHEKLVNLYAVVSTEPMYIVTEFLCNGSLLDYFSTEEGKSTNLTEHLNMSIQVAEGMAYIERMKYIHRDLRAANILVGRNQICKIADFGLARLINDNEYTSTGKKFPIKWTAPEAIAYKTFSIKSDVWSFAVLLTEIFSRGKIPYAFHQNSDILPLLETGYRMPKPTTDPPFPQSLYELMLKCWNLEAAERPTFEHIHKFFLENIYQTESDYQSTYLN